MVIQRRRPVIMNSSRISTIFSSWNRRWRIPRDAASYVKNLERSTAPITDVKPSSTSGQTVKIFAEHRKRVVSGKDRRRISRRLAAALGHPVQSIHRLQPCKALSPRRRISLWEVGFCGPITGLHMNCQFVIHATRSARE